MNWSNVRLIFRREVRDQLRDRRTLFMIVVLPILLYPLLGMSMFQVAQFIREQPTRVLVLGAEDLPAAPALIEEGKFAPALLNDPQSQGLTELHFAEVPAADAPQRARQAVEQGDFEAVVAVPAGFARRLELFRRDLSQRAAHERGSQPVADVRIPGPEIYYNTAKEKSQLAYLRVTKVLDRWTDEIGRENLKSSDLPESAARPFILAEHDTANESQRKAVVWSKILPFLLLIWALTGAFYPAVDLCAGEKERGTLETLLSSPAERSEIVWGKLLTVMLFSVVTAALNIFSMGLTGSLVMSQFPGVGPPPLWAPILLLAALLPVSALFSALCLALAAFARSSKEGQYYLMPVLLVTMPLVLLPMSPGVELNLGNALIPITGVVLLLRTMLEGEYWQALPMLLPVAGVTILCCLFSIRWAIDQFNSESVLFRESERWDLGLWLKHMLRDREDTPSATEAVFCGVLILLVRFFMSFALPQPETFRDLAVLTVVTQLVVIGTPALLMTIMLTRSPARTLSLRLPPLASVPAAVLLAVALHPLAGAVNQLVQRLYPVSERMQQSLAALMADPPGAWQMVLVLGLVPAVIEELAFRGFMLSGFRRLGHKWRAIALSSFFFGITHAIFQQSIVACLLGLLIGYLVVQTGSLLPGIAFHFVHNSLALLATRATPAFLAEHEWLRAMGVSADEGLSYGWAVTFMGTALAVLLLAWFRGLSYARTSEERLQEAIDQNVSQPALGS
jgi:sodium transport system permease protein